MKPMKTLSNDLLTGIVFGKHEYNVNLTFDNVIRFFNLIDPNYLTERRVLAAFFLLVPEAQLDAGRLTQKQIYRLLSELIAYINWSPYSVADSDHVDITGEPLPIHNNPKYYDFEQDAMAIYASFKQVYNVDLWDERGKLHWVKFQALLFGLPENCQFTQIITIRQREITPPPANDRDANLEYTRQLALKRRFALKTSLLERLQALDNKRKEEGEWLKPMEQ